MCRSAGLKWLHFSWLVFLCFILFFVSFCTLNCLYLNPQFFFPFAILIFSPMLVVGWLWGWVSGCVVLACLPWLFHSTVLSLFAELQAFAHHGRPLPRYQVALCFGEEFPDPQRQRKLITAHVSRISALPKTSTLLGGYESASWAFVPRVDYEGGSKLLKMQHFPKQGLIPISAKDWLVALSMAEHLIFPLYRACHLWSVANPI